MKNEYISETPDNNQETFTVTPLIEQIEREIMREEVLIEMYRDYLELAQSAEERFPDDSRFKRHTTAIQAILMNEYAELGKLRSARSFLISIQQH